jgi:hypothetical protein
VELVLVRPGAPAAPHQGLIVSNHQPATVAPEVLPADPFDHPRHWGECRGGPRPCPLVGCLYNNYLEVRRGGTIKFLHPGRQPEDVSPPSLNRSRGYPDVSGHSQTSPRPTQLTTTSPVSSITRRVTACCVMDKPTSPPTRRSVVTASTSREPRGRPSPYRSQPTIPRGPRSSKTAALLLSGADLTRRAALPRAPSIETSADR